MNVITGNRGQGLLMVGRIFVEAAVAFFITAALLHYGANCLRIGTWLASLQLVPAAIALSLPTLAFWLGVTMIFGRIYCSTVCPLGALIDLGGRVRPKSKVFRYKRPANTLRAIVAAIGLALWASGWLLPRQWMEPFGLYASLLKSLTAGSVTLAAITSAAILGVLTYIAYKRGRLFCNTLCPLGTLVGYFAQRSAFHIDINTDRCIQCRKCVDACKAECIDLNDHVADMSRCVVCFNCLPACPNEAIAYTLSRHTLSTPLMQKIKSLKTDNPSTTLACDNTSTSSTTSSKTEFSKPTEPAQEQ